MSVLGSLNDGHGGFGGHINARQIGMGVKQLPALVIGFRFDVMVFDSLKKRYLGMQSLERLLKGRQLYGVFGDVQRAQRDGDLALPVQKSSHQVADQSAARHGIHGNDREPVRLGRVSRDANDRNS